jgi:hypothetical protein
MLYHGFIGGGLASCRSNRNLGVACGPAPALKSNAGAGNVVAVLASAHSGALLVGDPWPARPFVSAALVLVATTVKTLRRLCMNPDIICMSMREMID